MEKSVFNDAERLHFEAKELTMVIHSKQQKTLLPELKHFWASKKDLLISRSAKQ